MGADIHPELQQTTMLSATYFLFPSSISLVPSEARLLLLVGAETIKAHSFFPESSKLPEMGTARAALKKKTARPNWAVARINCELQMLHMLVMNRLNVLLLISSSMLLQPTYKYGEMEMVLLNALVKKKNEC